MDVPTASPADAFPCAAEETEPAHLERLSAMLRDRGLSKGQRQAKEAEYFAQYAKWRTIQARIAAAISTLSGSEFWETLCEALHDHWACQRGGHLAHVEEVVCLCLGHLEDHASIYQLALLILLLEKLGIQHERCSVFDPCHSVQEAGILKHLGFTVPRHNAEARIRARRMTLFYMPHADYRLTSNLIETNRHCLNLVAILGNSLAWVSNPDADCADKPQQVGSSRAPQVEKVLPFVKETSLPDTLSKEVRGRLAIQVPRVLKAFGNGPVDVLDCALATFPPRGHWRDVEWSSEPACVRSKL